MGRIVGVATAPIFPICRANCRAQSFSMIHESAPIAKTEGQDRTSNVREHPYWNSLSPNHLPCVGCLTYRYSRTSKRCIHPPPTPAHSLKSSDLDPTNGRSGEAVIVSSWPNPGRRRHDDCVGSTRKGQWLLLKAAVQTGFVNCLASEMPARFPILTAGVPT